MAKPASVLPCPALEGVITQIGLGPLLGGQDIGLAQEEARLPGDPEKRFHLQGLVWVVKASGEIGMAAGVGQEGIQLLKAHGPRETGLARPR
jgi:hypothetical protein